MEIRTRHYNGVAILSVNGQLDSAATSQFSQAVAEQVASGYYRLVLDLKKVDFLNSVAVKAMIEAVQLTRRHGGDFRLANARARVKQVLNLAGVDVLIKAYPNVVGATASYFPGPMSEAE